LALASLHLSFVKCRRAAIQCVALLTDSRSERCKRHAEARGTRSSSSGPWSGLNCGIRLLTTDNPAYAPRGLRTSRMVLFVKCGSCVWPAGLTELLPELVLEGVPPVAACLDGTLVDADDEASRDHAVVGVEETDHVVVAATSRVEVVQVRSGRGEPDDEYDSRKGDAHRARRSRVELRCRRVPI
jgi:hypothetical protein